MAAAAGEAGLVAGQAGSMGGVPLAPPGMAEAGGLLAQLPT